MRTIVKNILYFSLLRTMSGIWNYLWGNSVKNNVEFELIEIDKSSIKEILNKHLNSRIQQLKLLNIINASNRIDVPQKEQLIIKIELPDTKPEPPVEIPDNKNDKRLPITIELPDNKNDVQPPNTIELPDNKNDVQPPITIELPSKPEVVQCDRKVMLNLLKEQVLAELFPEITGLKEIAICEIPQTFKDEYTSYKDQQLSAIKNKQKNKKRKNH